jgi:hypothetical protein
MIRKTILTVVIATIVSFGIAGSAGADPDGSQRLRGLGGRVFAVNVYDVFADVYFDNCYTFYADGTWDDPGFPELGNWIQDSNGAKTGYSASAFVEDLDIGAPFLVNILLEQQGMVTPARGRGNLQLWAFSEAFSEELGGLIGQFESVGYEVEECPFDL